MPKKQIEEAVETKEEKQKRAHKDILFDYLPYLIIILVVVIIRTFIATPIRVNGTSMDDTLKNGETMILNKLAMHVRGIKRWDIVVIRTDESYLIKRVIALPGETINYEDGILYINNQVMEDPFSLTETENFRDGPVMVGPNEFFVMGDNRSISQDSRLIGPISRNEIRGKTNIILFPLDRFGIIK